MYSVYVLFILINISLSFLMACSPLKFTLPVSRIMFIHLIMSWLGDKGCTLGYS